MICVVHFQLHAKFERICGIIRKLTNMKELTLHGLKLHTLIGY